MPQAHGNLRTIKKAYFDATNEMGRPPANIGELMPYLSALGDPAVLLKSPDDGEDFVILWGMDYRTVQMENNQLPVLAYEKNGRDGMRYVLQTGYVSRLSDADFKKLPFPAGHVPRS